MKTVAYIRVSTEEQANEGVSLAAQRARVEAYASLYDLQLVEVIIDAGESAKSLKRPGLQRALAMLKSGKADGLVVMKLDRLTRSIRDWQDLIDAYFCEKRGKQLLSVSDSIDTRTAAGRMVLNLLLVVSQWEREAIAERTRDAMQHKIKMGERCGKVRFGFDLAADGKTLIPNTAEQECIDLMHKLRTEGQTFQAICDELHRRNIGTKEGRAEWIPSTIRRILTRAA